MVGIVLVIVCNISAADGSQGPSEPGKERTENWTRPRHFWCELFLVSPLPCPGVLLGMGTHAEHGAGAGWAKLAAGGDIAAGPRSAASSRLLLVP